MEDFHVPKLGCLWHSVNSNQKLFSVLCSDYYCNTTSSTSNEILAKSDYMYVVCACSCVWRFLKCILWLLPKFKLSQLPLHNQLAHSTWKFMLILIKCFFQFSVVQPKVEFSCLLLSREIQFYFVDVASASSLFVSWLISHKLIVPANGLQFSLLNIPSHHHYYKALPYKDQRKWQ